MFVNEHFLNLKAGYLFPEIARRVRAFQAERPGARLIRLGIGDVTEPLPPACVAAMHSALDELARPATFRGYGPEQGYDFLRAAIVRHEFQPRGAPVEPDEIFVSDGSKPDGGNLLDLFGPGNRVAVMDPVYPVYVDTNVMAGHAGPPDDRGEYAGLVYLRANPANRFTPELPDEHVDVAYLCYPNNPTGATASRAYLQQWVDYANAHGTLLIFDAAYQAFVRDASVPRSIYECPGARRCAIELRSFSKTAGFTGVRAAFTVVPKELVGRTRDGRAVELHKLWHRRQSTKFNGIGYVVQRGCEACYTDDGAAQIKALVDGYMANAALIRAGLARAGIACHGGTDAPYVWAECPRGADSWSAFDKLLRDAEVVTTPGAGFGRSGEGFFRVSAFNSRANVEEALARVARVAW